jgi:hypothetical protein
MTQIPSSECLTHATLFPQINTPWHLCEFESSYFPKSFPGVVSRSLLSLSQMQGLPFSCHFPGSNGSFRPGILSSASQFELEHDSPGVQEHCVNMYLFCSVCMNAKLLSLAGSSLVCCMASGCFLFATEGLSEVTGNATFHNTKSLML